MNRDILIGIDSGTSVVKSVAFDLKGRTLAVASVPNRYSVAADGRATQPMDQTWQDCATTLRALGEKVPQLAARCAAVSVTGQGDGTWLIDKEGAPCADAWLWLDARAASLVGPLCEKASETERYAACGTGLNACQQGVQMAYMQAECSEILTGATTAFHCKDWLYYNLTNLRATDPSEASFTFGNYQTRQYETAVIESLGLESLRSVLPQIVDGSQSTQALTDAAAQQTGLLSGTPVTLGYVDVVCTAMGAGAYTRGVEAGCTIIGTTGMHMRSMADHAVRLNKASTGYIMPLPVAGRVLQLQSNMASTLNIDWLLNVASDLLSEFAPTVPKADLLAHVGRWLEASEPGLMLYHPYISEAGERGPFIDHNARASFVGLVSSHRFADMMRAAVEALGLAARDCYAAMGGPPDEVRLTGGAARSGPLREILAAGMNASVRCSQREEAGAAGAAMMAAVAIGAYDDMDACVAEWVTPLLSAAELPKADLVRIYDRLFPQYLAARHALAPVWQGLSAAKENVDE